MRTTSAEDEGVPARDPLLPDGRIQCDRCPRDCKLHEGQPGMCFVRQRIGNEMR
jgi:pyruvate formate lyase activating enzyme